MGLFPVIPTSELTPDNVPLPTEHSKLGRFALSFVGYQYMGGLEQSFQRLQDLQVQFPPTPEGLADLDKWSIDDVRLDLFLEQRSTRLAAQDNPNAWDNFYAHAAEIVGYLRHRLFNEDLPPTS